MKQDKLEQLLEMQAYLNHWIRQKRCINMTQEEWILQWTRAIVHEATELEDAFNWKHWKNKKEIDWENVKEEIIDLWHFLLSLTIDAGLTANDVINEYLKKNEENYNRQRGLSEKQGYKIEIG